MKFQVSTSTVVKNTAGKISGERGIRVSKYTEIGLRVRSLRKYLSMHCWRFPMCFRFCPAVSVSGTGKRNSRWNSLRDDRPELVVSALAGWSIQAEQNPPWSIATAAGLEMCQLKGNRASDGNNPIGLLQRERDLLLVKP